MSPWPPPPSNPQPTHPTRKVIVYGVFERIGIVAAWDVANNSPYTAIAQMPAGFKEKNGKLKWNLDGLPAGMPSKVQCVEDGLPGQIKGCILASEAPAEPAEIEYVLNSLPDLQKVVFLSSTSAPNKESLVNKLNPFSKAEKWCALFPPPPPPPPPFNDTAPARQVGTCRLLAASGTALAGFRPSSQCMLPIRFAAENAVRVVAQNLGLECTIVRAGGLKGGPFYQSNPEFQGALEDNLFDMQGQVIHMSSGESRNISRH